MAAKDTILIIDDRQENLYITKETIKALMPECEVITALGAREGLRSATPDISVILADVQMPNMSGVEVCRRIKADQDLKHIPVFLITSHRTIASMKVEGLEAGAMDFISRPMNSQELIAKIRVGLRVRGREDTLKEERDVLTDQVEAASLELAERDMRLRQISEHIKEVFWLLDVEDPDNYRVLYVSPAFEDLWQITAEYIYDIPTAWYDCIHEDDKGRVATEFTNFVRGKGRYELEYRIIRPDGTPLDIEAKGSLIKNQEGKVCRAAGIAYDITERKFMERQLLQATKMESIGQLAAGITHEINTPTQFVQHNTLFLHKAFEDFAALIKEYKKLLNATASDPALEEVCSSIQNLYEKIDGDFLLNEIPETLEQSLEGLRRISSIVQAIKSFAHQPSSERKAVNINDLINGVITMTTNEWKYHSELVLDLAENIPLLICAPDLINQAVLNLIINAANTNTEKVESTDLYKVTLGVQSLVDGDDVVIRIQDEGMGIPEAIRSRVFELFFTTKKEGVGSGQGLAIVHRIIVDEHGGAVYFTSQMGKGTTFEIRLPISAK